MSIAIEYRPRGGRRKNGEEDDDRKENQHNY